MVCSRSDLYLQTVMRIAFTDRSGMPARAAVPGYASGLVQQLICYIRSYISAAFKIVPDPVGYLFLCPAVEIIKTAVAADVI